MTERRKLCEKCGSAWKTVEQKSDPIVETINTKPDMNTSGLLPLPVNEFEQENAEENTEENFSENISKNITKNIKDRKITFKDYEKPNYLKIRKAPEMNL